VGARGLLAWRDGDTSEAIDLFNKSLAMVDTLGLSDKYRGGSHTNLALALVDKNDFEHAAEHLILGREALERATDTGWLAVNYVADVNARMFVALRDQAHDTVAKRAAAADALRCLEQHEAFIRVNGYSQNVALMLALKGEALLWLDRHDEAESTLLEARRCCRELAGVPTFERWFRVSMLLAEIAAARFDIDAAAAFLRDAKEFVQKRELAKRTFPVRRIAWLYERYCELCRRLKIEA
jgi:tetratricopeptide (TPR) repeat protein